MIDNIDFSLLIATSEYKRKEIAEKTGIKYVSLGNYAKGGNMMLSQAIKLLKFFGYTVPDDPVEYLVHCYKRVGRKTTIYEYCKINSDSYFKWKNKSIEPKFKTYIDFLNSIEKVDSCAVNKNMFKTLEKI
jgi:hypothetical protein